MYHSKKETVRLTKITKVIKKWRIKHPSLFIVSSFSAVVMALTFLVTLTQLGVGQRQDNRTLATYMECNICDVNQNGFFDRTDIDIIGACTGQEPAPSVDCQRTDIIKDGIVDIADISYCAVRSDQFGECVVDSPTVTETPVPEETSPTPTTGQAVGQGNPPQSQACDPVDISQLAREFPMGSSHCGNCDLTGNNGCWDEQDYIYSRDICFKSSTVLGEGIMSSSAPAACQQLDVTSLTGSVCGVPTPTGTCQSYDCYPEWNEPNQYPRRDGFIDQWDINYCTAQCACAPAQATVAPTSPPRATTRGGTFTPPTISCRTDEMGGVVFSWTPSDPPPCTYDAHYLETHPGAGDNPTDTGCSGYWIRVSTNSKLDPATGTFASPPGVVNTYTYANSISVGTRHDLWPPGTKFYGHVTVSGSTQYPDGTFGSAFSQSGGWIWSNLVECENGIGVPYFSPTPTPLPGNSCTSDADCTNSEYCTSGENSIPRYCKAWTETTCSQYDGDQQKCMISGDAPCSWLPTTAGACGGRAGNEPGESGLCLKPGETGKDVTNSRCSAIPAQVSCQTQPGGECGRGRDCCGTTLDPNHASVPLACNIFTNFSGTCQGYNGGSYGMGANCSCPLVDLNGDGFANYHDRGLYIEKCQGKPTGWTDGQVTCLDYDGNGLVMSNGRGADNDASCLMSCIDSYRRNACSERKTQSECNNYLGNCQWYSECNLCDDSYNSSIPGSGVGCNSLTGMGEVPKATPTPIPNRPSCSSVGSASGLQSYCYQSNWCGGGTHTCIYNTYNCAANECCCVPNELAPTPPPCRGEGSSCNESVGMCCDGLWCEGEVCVDPIEAGLHMAPPATSSLGDQPTSESPAEQGQTQTLLGCNSQCQTNLQCDSGFCFEGRCRLANCPSNSDCYCQSSISESTESIQTLEEFIRLLSNRTLLDLFIQFVRGLMGGSQQ